MENIVLDNFISKFIDELSKIDEIQAIVLGGSRAKEKYDDKSDYDFYIYSTNSIDSKTRNEILSKYCSYLELGNCYWEQEDNGTFESGVDFDIIYRNLNDFTNTIADVVENCISYNGFSTCLWYNLLNSKILFDRDNQFQELKKRFSVSYPKRLKENIIKKNMNLLSDSIVSYDKQILKSIYRKDIVNLNNRIAAFFASYFDIIFTLNELANPGEKRIVEICLNECKILPNNFEKNINALINLQCIDSDATKASEIIGVIVGELKKII